MFVGFRLLVSALLFVVSLAAHAITNPNFAPEQTFAGSDEEFAGPDGWVLRDLDDRRAVLSTVDFALVGTQVFWFESLTDGYGDNKLDQCLVLTNRDFAMSFHTWSLTADSDLRARVNVESYPGAAECEARDDRLDNEDFNFTLDGPAAAWHRHELDIELDPDATHVRISLRARDRTNSGDPADPSIRLFFDALEATNATLVNGDFEGVISGEARFGEDAGPFGWTLRSVRDFGLIAPEASAALGSAFRFTELDEGFGDNTIEQCVDVSALDPFVFDVSVWPNVSDSDLRVRLAIDFHQSQADCITRENRIDDPDFDFRTDAMTQESWNELRTGLIEVPPAAEWARIALRARDRRDSGPTPIILFDQVALTDRFFVGGSVTGLAAGAELILENNGEPLVIASDGAFTFPSGLAHMETFTVTVSAQPDTPSQTCTVSGGEGEIDADDATELLVECSTNRFSVGGQVEGLETGAGLLLQLNADLSLTVSENGGFVFPQDLLDGSDYAVSVLENPSSPDQTCTVANGEGVLAGSDVDDVRVTCATDTFSVGGQLSNLLEGTSLILQNNGADDLILSSNGPFIFNQEVADGAVFQVTVLTQPSGPNQSCQVSNGDGVITGADVTNVYVNCELERYPVGGVLSGLAADNSVTVQLNNAETLVLEANGVFEFPGLLDDGSAYTVSVIAQPTQPNQLCTISNASGNLSGGPVTDLLLNCETETYPVGGTLSGLAPGATVVLQNNGGDDLTLSNNGEFEFATVLDDGSDFAVSVVTQPTSPSQVCSVSQGSGTLNGGPATDVRVDCENESFFVGGFLSGLSAGNSLILNDGTGQTLALEASGAFVFAQPLDDGSSYQVEIQQQPTNPPQTCVVENASGLIDSADVTSVEVTCRGVATEPDSSPGGPMAVLNPEFGLEQAFAGSGEQFSGPQGWIMRDLEDRRGLVSESELAKVGTRVFRFESPRQGFGDNKLDQCLPLTDPAAFSMRLHAWSSVSDADVQVRVNVESYPGESDCLARTNRLDNTDFDFPLIAPRARWQALDLALGIDSAASYARISIRMRDRSDGGGPSDPPVIVLFDDISVTGAVLVNGDFEASSLEGARFEEGRGPLGWVLRSAADSGVIIPEPSALGGSAFYFSQLGSGFGDNSLEQCVPVDSDRLRLSARVWPEVSDSDLRIRLNLDLYADLTDCLARDNRLARHDSDFRTSNLTQASWNRVTAHGIERPGEAAYARIALRVRDRMDPAPANSPLVLFDQVGLTGSRPDALPIPVNQPWALALMLLLMIALAGHSLGRFTRP